MKKILFVIPNLSIGGAEKNLLNISRYLSQNHNVTILSFGTYDKLIKKEISNNVLFIQLNSSNFLISLSKLLIFLKENKFDHVISFLNSANLACLITNFILRNKFKLYISIRNHLSSHYNLSLKDKIIINSIKIFLNYCEKIICVSEYVAKDSINNFSFPKSKIKVIYNPVIDKSFVKKTKEKISKKYLKKITKNRYLCCVGSLSQQKDFITVLKAFNIIRNKVQYNLIIIGEGNQKKLLENFITKNHLKKRVFLIGKLSNPLPIIKKSSIFISSSLWEGLPSVIIEAVYFAKYIITTDCPGGGREVLKNYKYCKFFPMKNYIKLSKIILSKNKMQNLKFVKSDNLKKFQTYQSLCYLN